MIVLTGLAAFAIATLVLNAGLAICDCALNLTEKAKRKVRTNDKRRG